MKVTLGRAVLRGQADRIELAPDGAVRILDYKTGSSKPTRADLPRHAQLGAYQVAVAEGGFDEVLPSHVDDGERACAGAALLQLGKASNKGVTLNLQPPLAEDEDPRWAHTLIEETALGMSRDRFLARPDEQLCGRCPVRRTCPAQPEGAWLA